MLNLLIRIFIKDPENVREPGVRQKYGTLCSLYGIFLNIVLFVLKFFAGVVSGSVAITADAFNNLSDAGSSIITLIGFRLASKKPDPDHPFGHGRAESLAGLALSVMIGVMGVELGKTSVEKIIHPEAVEAGILPAAILVVSILVKFYMCMYNKRIGRKISSSAMQATATDSLSDCISTGVVLISMALTWIFGINIDGWAGLAVAVFICIAAVGAMKDTLSPLLGQAPEEEIVREIEQSVMSHPEILDIHDLIVHDYGPGRLVISLHAEVDGHSDFFSAHDVIDNAEDELREKFGCLATIHLDPIDTQNAEVGILRKNISDTIKAELDPALAIHDLRLVPGTTHTNVIFDAVLPQGFKMSDREAAEAISAIVKRDHPGYNCVIDIDHSYI